MATTVLERENSDTLEEREHKQHISDNYRNLIANRDEKSQYSYRESSSYAAAAAARAAEQPVRTPVQPAIPSAAKRIADYVPYTVGMTKIQRMGDMSSYTSPKVVDYAPVTEPKTSEQEAAPVKTQLFEGLLLRDGQLYDMNAPTIEPEIAPAPAATPAYEPSYVPEYDPSIIPAEEEDFCPTPRTMESLRSKQEQEEERSVGFFASLSAKTKLTLAAVAAVIVVLIALVCVNTAVLNSLSADIGARQTELSNLIDQAQSIRAEIEELTDPENIAVWAVENGMEFIGG